MVALLYTEEDGFTFRFDDGTEERTFPLSCGHHTACFLIEVSEDGAVAKITNKTSSEVYFSGNLLDPTPETVRCGSCEKGAA